jgi:hypothetical protein
MFFRFRHCSIGPGLDKRSAFDFDISLFSVRRSLRPNLSDRSCVPVPIEDSLATVLFIRNVFFGYETRSGCDIYFRSSMLSRGISCLASGLLVLEGVFIHPRR